MEAKVESLEQQIQGLKILGDQRQAELAAEGQRLLEGIQTESATVKAAIGQTVVEAKAEFDRLREEQRQVIEAAAAEFKKQREQQEQRRQDILTVYQAMQIAVVQTNEKIEAGITEGGSTSGKKDVQYLPDKQMIPDEYEGQLEGWRAWKEDMLRLFDKKNRGMRRFLEEVEKEKRAIDQSWKDSRTSTYGTKVVNDAESLWKTFKNKTKK